MSFQVRLWLETELQLKGILCNGPALVPLTDLGLIAHFCHFMRSCQYAPTGRALPRMSFLEPWAAANTSLTWLNFMEPVALLGGVYFCEFWNGEVYILFTYVFSRSGFMGNESMHVGDFPREWNPVHSVSVQNIPHQRSQNRGQGPISCKTLPEPLRSHCLAKSEKATWITRQYLLCALHSQP